MSSPATSTVQPTAPGMPCASPVAACSAAPQHGFLGEEAGERRDRGEREQRDGDRPVGVRDAPGQAAHPGHGGQRVGAGGVDDHARAEEEQGLERAVRDEVEDGGAAVADGQGAEHVAELADRRVGQHALDVVLGQRGQPRADHGDRGHHGEHDQRGGGGGEDREETGHEIDAGRHHRRGVDQRRDRASGRPSRPAARCAAGTAPTCPRHRPAAAARSASGGPGRRWRRSRGCR